MLIIRDYRGIQMQLGMKVNPVRMTAPLWEERFGSPDFFFRFLKESGIDFIEFPLGEESDLYLYYLIGETAIEAGLACSLHPYLHGNLAPEVFDERSCSYGLGEIIDLAQNLSDRSEDITSVIFHGGLARYEPHYRSLNQATEAANRFFEWIGNKTISSSGICAFAETQLPHDANDDELVRLGDTFDGVMSLIKNTSVGVCWDVGHSWRSTVLKKQPPYPPTEFLQRVGHVHLHDAYWDSRGNFFDHNPLGLGNSPWKEYLSLLFNHGFNTRILLEVTIDQSITGYKEIGEWIKKFRQGVNEAKRLK